MSLTPQTDRKRDRLRAWFHRSPPPLPGYTTPGSTQPAISTSTNKSIASSILADALEALQSDHRETIRILLQPTNVVSADDAFDEVYAHARELQQRSKIKRWTWTYRGRQIYLFEQADKVVRLLDRFKAVGDIVANVDPVHVGLPWAGVRAILEVALADSSQRAVLVTGIELALYVSNRLKDYLDTFACLSSSAAKNNLRKSIVSLYAHVLEFLARAIHVQQKKHVARIVSALWNSSDLTEFEAKCDRLCIRASEEARICDGKVSLEVQLRALHEIHEVHRSVTSLEDKVDLSNLKAAKEAAYDSSDEGGLPRCLPNTRTDLLEQISNWAADHTGKRIFWLCGKAGTGKSTISRTVAEKLDDDGLLGASFFFNRGHGDRSHAKLLFPTIARQLAGRSPDIAKAIAAAMAQDYSLDSKHPTTQFDNLLLKPLQSIDRDILTASNLVLVIDALDECDNSASIETILLLLSSVEKITSLRLRIFVTSRPDVRPERPVELGFRKMSGDLYHDVRLEEAQEGSIAHDIKVFYEKEFSNIRDATSFKIDELPAQWPGDENIGLLVEKAVPLFIFASTLCRFIKADPKPNLNIMLRESRYLPGLRGMYLLILDSVVLSEDDDKAQDRILDFKRIAGTAVLLFNPLTAIALASLLSLVIKNVDEVLCRLHSVLNIPRAADGKMDCTTPITLFHQSFRDFLVDAASEDNNKFWINVNETHRTLGMHCIRLLESGGLKEDVCGVVAPGTRKSAVAKSKVHSSLPEAVAYACCYWVSHTISGGDRPKDNGAVHRFLRKHVLHWIEALCWLQKLSHAFHYIDVLKSWVDHDEGGQLLSLLNDVSRFLQRNRYIIDKAPLQIYMSALLFAPRTSDIRKIFGDSLIQYFDVMPGVLDKWDTNRQKLEGHDGPVMAVAFSPDGKTVVSGSQDNTVTLWDAATGDERLKLKGHDSSVATVAFSLDGKMVASGSYDGTVRLRDAATGEQREVLQSHESSFGAVAFSLDCKTVALGSQGNTVRLWDIATGKESQKLQGHDDRIKAVTFSRDGNIVASGSDDKTVRLWDVATGKEIQVLRGHDNWVYAVAFSPDDKIVASGSRDSTARLWDIATGKELQILQGHDRVVGTVAFSPDGAWVASGSDDSTIRLWDVTTGEERQVLQGHNSSVNAVAFSLDCNTVASGSYNGTVRIWDAAMSEGRRRFEQHDKEVSAVAFSLDGKTVASGSNDNTVRLWDVATGEERKVLEGHDDSVTAVAFSPDGKTVASGSHDETVRLWDVATGEERQKLETSTSVSRVAFSNDGSSLETDIGRLDLGLEHLSPGLLVTKPQPALLLEASWIKRDNADFVWLPHEYRGNLYDVCGSRLVIGQMSGAISLFSFK